ncbi:MAG: 1-(5-phosphoribosyl)-5-[(5-phosphoribosylamino)methylideneamino]imidazole-4-carboxamide isomerase [Peptococcaceae bacterium]|nr:1-(5-phosphoribosyl)-5-[(5-phosphoribosylamino)methylideneamino]imidazole-4-carboxamide isomerase [Peptococcaceae bacterium]
MEIFPAIDLRDGKVVRLREGDYRQMKVYGSDPLEAAESFRAKGASHLHVVDLDGAKDGSTANFQVISRIAARGGLFIQAGGGIRNEERLSRYLEAGVSRVILGTAAVKDPPFLRAMAEKYGEKVAVGVDAREGRVAVAGWLEVTELDSLEFCRRLAELGVKTIIYTDISRDGRMEGANLEACRALSAIGGLKVVASGGITFEEEIAALKKMGCYGAILGKALYENKLDLNRAIALAK